MYIEVTRSMFHDQFHAYGRINDFSYEARNILYDHYTDMEEDYGEKKELDVIEICCDWGQYTEEELMTEYNMSPEELCASEEMLVLYVPDGSYLVRSF